MKQSGLSFLKRRMWPKVWGSDQQDGGRRLIPLLLNRKPDQYGRVQLESYYLETDLTVQLISLRTENIFWVEVKQFKITWAGRPPGGRPFLSGTLLLLDSFKRVSLWSVRRLKAGRTRRGLNLWHCQWKWPIKDLWSVRLEPCVVINLCLPIWPGGGRRGGLVLCGVSALWICWIKDSFFHLAQPHQVVFGVGRAAAGLLHGRWADPPKAFGFLRVPSFDAMNFCIPDMYEMPHPGVGGYAVQSGGEHCMYPGEGPGYGQYEPQPLHHPPCMEQAWPPSQHFSCSYAGGPSSFKSEFSSGDVPLSHFHYQPEYFPEVKADFPHLQWMQGAHRKGTTPPQGLCCQNKARAIMC